MHSSPIPLIGLVKAGNKSISTSCLVQHTALKKQTTPLHHHVNDTQDNTDDDSGYNDVREFLKEEKEEELIYEEIGNISPYKQKCDFVEVSDDTYMTINQCEVVHNEYMATTKSATYHHRVGYDNKGKHLLGKQQNTRKSLYSNA